MFHIFIANSRNVWFHLLIVHYHHFFILLFRSTCDVGWEIKKPERNKRRRRESQTLRIPAKSTPQTTGVQVQTVKLSVSFHLYSFKLNVIVSGSVLRINPHEPPAVSREAKHRPARRCCSAQSSGWAPAGEWAGPGAGNTTPGSRRWWGAGWGTCGCRSPGGTEIWVWSHRKVKR